MEYRDPLVSVIANYPNHDINPDEKGAEWCTQYAKAAWVDFAQGIPKGVFANNRGEYDKNRMYALGKQDVEQYKTYLGIDADTNNTWLSVDWTVQNVVGQYRDKAISRLMKEKSQVVATPVDMLAKTELSQLYGKLKTKIMLRQMAQQDGNEELANHPMLAPVEGEPQDIEELEMRINYGEQFNRSMDAELAIALGFYENKYDQWRKTVYEDLFDFGVAGYKEWLGTDNKAHFRRVNPENVVVSYARSQYFDDIVHAGEVIEVPLVDMATFTDEEGNLIFTEKDLNEFAASLAGKFGNPTLQQYTNGGIKGWDKFKCKVLDLEFFSYNTHTYRNVLDENGNADFRRAENHRKSEKYTKKKFKVVYKVKWVIGTDKCYDYGLASDQKRSNIPEKKWDTSLSYKFVAPNFYEMKADSMMSRLIPLIDDYQLTRYKIQNFKNRAVPSGWFLDLDSMENVALTKGGKDMEPQELLQMFFETGVLLGRSIKADGSPMGPNWKPVIPIENTAASELAMLFQDMANTLMAIERMTGFNDITSGNPNPKTLVPGYELANESTNDALFQLAHAETSLTERLAYDVLKRMQQGIRKSGKLNGYAYALNANVLQFISVSPEIAFREYGIMLEKKATEQERIWLMQMMQPDIQNGFLDTSDAVTLINTHNPKQAQIIWSVRVKRAKAQAQQYELQKIEMNNQGAKEAAMIGQQVEMQKLQMQIEAELRKEEMRIMGEIEKEKIRAQVQLTVAQQDSATKLQVASVDQEAKAQSSAIQGNAKVQSQIIANQGMIEKQMIANEKPQPTKKS